MEESKKNEQFSLTWLPKKTFEILAEISSAEIEKAKKEVIAKAGESLEIKGFRKGKAPENLVVEALGKNKILELTLEKIIPELYPKAIAKFGLKPLVSPKIELVSAKEGENWQVKFTSCEEPEIKLENYKDELKKLKAVEAIWTPEKGAEDVKKEKTAEDLAKEKDEKLDKIIHWLLENIKVEISELIIESEVNHKLAELLEQTQKLGLTIDQYLASTGKTVESLKNEYKDQVQRTITLQLLLSAIAEKENLVVNQEEIEKTISQAKTEEEKKSLESQKYLLASVLRQQKTLDFLANL